MIFGGDFWKKLQKLLKNEFRRIGKNILRLIFGLNMYDYEDPGAGEF
jgi:hypothetical protein